MWVYCSDISHLQTPICTENQPFLESLFPTHGRGVMEGWYPLVSPLKWLVWRKTSSRNLYDFPIWWLYQHWLVGYNQKKINVAIIFHESHELPLKWNPTPQKKGRNYWIPASWSSLDNKSSRQLAATTRTGSSSKEHGKTHQLWVRKTERTSCSPVFCGRIYMFAIDPISYSFDGKFMYFFLSNPCNSWISRW